MLKYLKTKIFNNTCIKPRIEFLPFSSSTYPSIPPCSKPANMKRCDKNVIMMKKSLQFGSKNPIILNKILNTK